MFRASVYKTGKYCISTAKGPYRKYPDIGTSLKTAQNLTDPVSSLSLCLSEKDCSNSTDSLCRGKGHGHWSHHTPLLLSRPRIWTGINLSDWSNVEEPCYVKTSLDTWHPSLTQGQMAKDALPPKFIIKWQSITHSHIVDLIMMQY